MPKLSSLSGNGLIRILEKQGFLQIRSKGSHVRMRSNDGHFVTIPIHSSKIIPKGLLRKIIREDIEISLDEFMKWLEK